MRERSTVLASATFGFVAIASLSVQSTHAVAADECLTKPNSPAPQGEHWYYRLDHAANRQCWRLGPEGLRVQKSAPQAEKESAPAAVAQPAAPVRSQRLETTGTAIARAGSHACGGNARCKSCASGCTLAVASNRPGCQTCLPPCSLHRIRSEARKPLAQATRYRWRTILRRRRQVNHLSPLPPRSRHPQPPTRPHQKW